MVDDTYATNAEALDRGGQPQVLHGSNDAVEVHLRIRPRIFTRGQSRCAQSKVTLP